MTPSCPPFSTERKCIDELLEAQVGLAKRLRSAAAALTAAEVQYSKASGEYAVLETAMLECTSDLVGALSSRRAAAAGLPLPAPPPPAPDTPAGAAAAASAAAAGSSPHAATPSCGGAGAEAAAAPPTDLAAFLRANEACYLLLYRRRAISLSGELLQPVELSEDERKAVGHCAVMALAQLRVII